MVGLPVAQPSLESLEAWPRSPSLLGVWHQVSPGRQTDEDQKRDERVAVAK